MNKMEMNMIEASNCLPSCPIGDGGRSSLLISVVYWPRFWLMLGGRLLTASVDIRGGCDSASLHCLDSDCQDEYFSLRGRCGAQNH